MANALAFFPWLTCRQEVQVGPIQLLPYVRGKAPGDLPGVTQADIDGVLRAYSRIHGSRVKFATMLQITGWQLGADADHVAQQLFNARRHITFAALSKRRLFRGHSEYTNSDTYELVVQRFKPGDTGGFAFSTRRRDTGTQQYWTADDFAFTRPQHVDAHATLSIDEPLLLALGNLPPDLAYVSEAVEEFNSANTDSLGVPMHVEMVMVKSAFERLLGIDQDAASFQRALSAVLHGIPEADARDGPVAAQWAKRWNGARPLDAWTRDFCVVRGTSAHGRRGGGGSSVWDARRHLAFAAILFPLVVKKVLADAGLMPLGHVDLERIKRLHWYLVQDPYAEIEEDDDDEGHPWVHVDSMAYVYAVAPTFYANGTE
jgi:hypothetical protein